MDGLYILHVVDFFLRVFIGDCLEVKREYSVI